jgi:hypothetical protein
VYISWREITGFAWGARDILGMQQTEIVEHQLILEMRSQHLRMPVDSVCSLIDLASTHLLAGDSLGSMLASSTSSHETRKWITCMVSRI